MPLSGLRSELARVAAVAVASILVLLALTSPVVAAEVPVVQPSQLQATLAQGFNSLVVIGENQPDADVCDAITKALSDADVVFVTDEPAAVVEQALMGKAVNSRFQAVPSWVSTTISYAFHRPDGTYCIGSGFFGGQRCLPRMLESLAQSIRSYRIART